MAPRCTTPTPVQPSSPAATAPNPRPASFPAAAAAANPRPAFFPAAAAANPRPAFFPGGNRAESPPSLLPRGGGGESPPSLYAPPRRASTRRPGETLRAAPESPCTPPPSPVNRSAAGAVPIPCNPCAHASVHRCNCQPDFCPCTQMQLPTGLLPLVPRHIPSDLMCCRRQVWPRVLEPPFLYFDSV
nr:proline-rich receptor-like protein kinase PERK9 [Lolium perenne]